MSHFSTTPQDSATEQSLPGSAGVSGVQLNAVRLSEEAGAERGLAFPGEDRGHSLAEMAQRDLDAALHLLADRAQYITGASGAAIALRQEGEIDMLCRASAGMNAPELGARLSAEFGLSGESVRTRQPLRCDDAERDARVNRESCRALGISSVAVMPVLSDGEVLGVFELFSGQPNAFGERDVAALQRLAEMVETAARFARAAGFPGDAGQPAVSDGRNFATVLDEESTLGDSTGEPTMVPSEPALVLKPLLWSASGAGSDAVDPNEDLICESLPKYGGETLALRGLHKCEACGFPVSEGRKLCVDCEEKSWRGQSRAGMRPAARTVPARTTEESSAEISEEDMPILAAAEETSPSWLAANKYALGAIVAAAVAIGVVVFLR